MKNIIGVGRVSAIYPDDMTAKVYLEDTENVTRELTIIQRGDDWIPEVGIYVLCLFIPYGSSNGFIIGEA